MLDPVLRNNQEGLDINQFAVEYFKNEIKHRAEGQLNESEDVDS